MNIGEKIKKLRSEKLMTQSELAGENITRNMLSCIENGTAQPSLSTLRYLASKLNVSAGYLLADGEEERRYLMLGERSNIKNAYLSQNYRICRDMCAEAEFELDDELKLIFAEAALALGIECFGEGALRSACAYFDEAVEVAEDCIYHTAHISATAAVYFRYMRRISAMLASDTIDESDAEVYAAISDEFSRYAIALETIEAGEMRMAENIIVPLDENQPYALHIKARRSMLDGNFDEAYRALYLILINPYKIQEPLMYLVFCDLEICCKEIKDFKGAYEYSNNKLEILQKMLSDSLD